MKSVSTMGTAKSLIRTILPSKRSKSPTGMTSKETPAEETERKLVKAEALHAWALHR